MLADTCRDLLPRYFWNCQLTNHQMGVQNKIFLVNLMHMVLGSVSCPKLFMSLDSNIGHPDKHGPRQSMALRHQHCPRWQIRPRSSSWPSMITEALDNNPDPGCYRVTDSDIALCHSPCPNDTIVSADALATQISLAPTAAHPADKNMVTGSRSEPRYPCGP